MLEECGRSCIEIDADMIDGVFDGVRQCFFQRLLIDIMLVLSDTDSLRVDLDEFCERVLDAAGDADGTADDDIVIA